MLMRRFYRYWIFLLCLVVFAIRPCQADESRYTIGAILPLSGKVASLGAYVRKGIELGLERLPAQQRDFIRVVYEDDQFDPVKTISAYRHLKAKGRLDAVFVAGSPAANALGPTVEREHVVMVAIGASDPSIAVDKEYSFIHWVTPPVLGEALAQESVRRGLKRFAFVSAEVTGAIADTDAAIEALKKRGLADGIVYRQNFVSDHTDFRSALTTIKQRQPEGVVVVLLPGALSSFARQFRDSKADAQLIGIETFEDESEVKAARGALEGAWYVNAADSTGTFIADYRSKYNEYPGWGAANAFDSLCLMAKAVTDVGQSNRAVRDYLRTVKNYAGATGVFSASGDNRFTLPAAVKRVTKEGFEIFKP